MDWVNVMTYDYTGEWTNMPVTTRPSSRRRSSRSRQPRTVELTMRYMVRERGMPCQPFGGGDPLLRPRLCGLGPLCIDPKAHPATRIPERDYRDIHRPVRTSPAGSRHWDDETKTPWLISANPPAVIGYDDAESVASRLSGR